MEFYFKHGVRQKEVRALEVNLANILNSAVYGGK